MTETKQNALIDFPCLFPIKVMGPNQPDFHDEIIEILTINDKQLQLKTIIKTFSSSGKYISITAKIYALNQEHLDKIYRELSSHPQAKFVL